MSGRVFKLLDSPLIASFFPGGGGGGLQLLGSLSLQQDLNQAPELPLGNKLNECTCTKLFYGVVSTCCICIDYIY
jgi:hypothetical protein